MDPKISVIVPCYNQGVYLPEALDSVLQQSYANWECLIVNDGSTDNTEEIAQRYLNTDARFKYIYQQNKGLSAARNAGLNSLSGDFVQFLDADDYLDKDKFSVLITQLRVDPRLDLLIADFMLFDQQTNSTLKAHCNLNREFNLEIMIKYWDVEFTIPIHCAIFKRALLLKGFQENLKAKEDWVMWVDVFQQQPVHHFDNTPRAFYRTQQHSMTKDQVHMQTFTFEAFKMLYNRFSEPDLRNMIFDRFYQYNKQLSAGKDETINFLRNSYTYKMGNIILYPLKKIRRAFNF